MSVKDEIRINLKELMVANGVKNVDLARAIGVSKVAVTNWLNGSNSIDIEHVPEICSFFEVSVDDFLSHASTRSLHSDEKKLVNMYRMADDKGKRTILTAARHALANSGQNGATAPEL